MHESEKECYQINLQRHFGGGEVYTRFFSKALLALDWKVTLLVHRTAAFWQDLPLNGLRIIPVADSEDIVKHLPENRTLVVAHGSLSGVLRQRVQQQHIYCCIAHMPFLDRKPPEGCHSVFAVSQYVIDTLQNKGSRNCYPVPLYGVADLERHRSAATIRAESPYDWDERKLRDRLLSYIYPLRQRLKVNRPYNRLPGLTLGIVSRITPIKQFPLLFELIAPVIEKFPDIHLEIFGSGGYASIRDLKKSIAPIRTRVRFWGQQKAVIDVYPLLDFLLTGLPEKEALGLNVIEAQTCGTPVIAVQAPPFTETVSEGKTGFFYTDPRADGARDFERLLRRITTSREYPKPLQATEHLAKFSFGAFTARVAGAMEFALRRHP